MYQNRITLIGFLGNDAITRTANNASFTVLSLATKSSYKDKKTSAKQRVWEVRVSSILKLDRAEKVSPEEQEHEEINPEEEAA